MNKLRVSAWLLGAVLAGCGEADSELSRRAGAQEQVPSWEEFLAAAHQDVEGVYVIDGDLPFENLDTLRAFYEENVKAGLGSRRDGLAVYYLNGADVKLSNEQKLNITYCVSSSSFGSNYSRVVHAMHEAAAGWEAASRVNFVHLSQFDGNCTASQTGVYFDVRQVSGQSYLARAFFPNYSRSSRNVLIDTSAYSSYWTLAGILRHELGHTLGFRHEHTRTTASGCYEDGNWRALTSYDRYSVMHYPQCNGLQGGDLVLTDLDKQGAAILYGSAGPASACGEETCVQPRGAYISHYTGAYCDGEEYYYTPYFSGTSSPNPDGIIRTWDGLGVASQYYSSVTTYSARDSSGTCYVNAWPSGNPLNYLVRVYRTPNNTSYCGETTCRRPLGRYFSHFTGAYCDGEEYYYTPYFSGTSSPNLDGVVRTWDGQGKLGTQFFSRVTYSARGPDGTCYANAWPSGNPLDGLVRVYR